MKILIATGIYAPQIGGPATYSKLLYDKLPPYGFDVVVVNFGKLLFLPKILRHIVYFFWVLVRGLRADLIYAQDPVSVGLPAMLAAKLLRKKFCIKIVGDYAWEQGVQRASVTDDLDLFAREHHKYSFFVRVLKQIEQRVALGADKVIVPSEYLKKIVTAWGVPLSTITVIYNGFNAPMVNEDRLTLREKLGIEGHALLSVGRLVPWKGFLPLVDMMPDLLREIPDAHLYIVGSGPLEDRLRTHIKTKGLQDKITLLGALPQEKLFEYIKASDVFVLNASYEGFSHQLLEVMALGTPIVTTSVGGNNEVMDGEILCGMLIAPNKMDDLIKIIKRLHTEPGFMEKVVMAGQKKALEFSNERMLKQLANELASGK